MPTPYERFIGHKKSPSPEYDEIYDGGFDYGSEEEGEMIDSAEYDSEDEEKKPVTSSHI